MKNDFRVPIYLHIILPKINKNTKQYLRTYGEYADKNERQYYLKRPTKLNIICNCYFQINITEILWTNYVPITIYKRRYTETVAVLNKTRGLDPLRRNNETTLNEATLNKHLLYLYKYIHIIFYLKT